MYDIYENMEIHHLDNQPIEQTTDMQMSSVMNKILLVVWGVLCLVGFAVAFIAKQPILGVIIIAIPTVMGMVIKPTFSLCLLMSVTPTGAGVGIGHVFSLNRGVGIAIAITFLLNIMVTRPKLRIGNGVLWILIIYTLWVFMDSLTSPYLKMEMIRAFTQFQLLALFLIVYWIIETNNPESFIWVLRSYVIGTLGTIALTFITGAAITSVEESVQDRYSATLGNAINANHLAFILAMAFLTAIYLLLRDKKVIWRMIYIVAILILPIVIFKTGSRGALVALAAAIMSPLLFINQVMRKPVLFISTLLLVTFMAGLLGFVLNKDEVGSKISARMADTEYAGAGINYRMQLNMDAVKSTLNNPMGKTHYGWIGSGALAHFPHNDFFYILGVYGFPGAILFLLFIFGVIKTIKRMPFCMGKIYARTLFIFILVSGLSHAFVYKKVFWICFAIVIASERMAYLLTQYKHSNVDNDIVDD